VCILSIVVAQQATAIKHLQSALQAQAKLNDLAIEARKKFINREESN